MKRKIICAVIAASLAMTTAAIGRMSPKGQDEEYVEYSKTPIAGVVSKVTPYSENVINTAAVSAEEVSSADNTVEDRIQTTTMYAVAELNIRTEPTLESEIYGTLGKGTEVTKTGDIGDWSAVIIDDEEYYVYSEYLSTEMPTITTSVSAKHLTSTIGRFEGPWGTETYYNLPMKLVISYMSEFGYDYSDYWIRDDGVKMLGNYVMCAADFREYPRGSIVETSLGTAIVCDTGTFTVDGSGVDFDICVSW